MPITAIRGGGTAKGLAQFTSVPYGWDTGYKAAQVRNAAGGGPIRVWFHGHSIMAGFKATNTMSDCWRWLVRNFLVAKYGRSADYFPVTLSQHFTDMSGVGTSIFTMVNPPWLLQTSPLAAAPYGFCFGNTRIGYLFGSLTAAALGYSGMGGDAAWVNPGAAQTIATFQHSVATWLETCQAYDLVAPNRGVAAPAMSYNTNGAGANNVTLTADNRVQVIPMATGLAAGKYDTVIKGTASTTAWLSGVTAHATTRGAAGVQSAHLGANSSVLSNMESYYLTNTLQAVDATSGVVGAGGFPMLPDLVISNHLLADCAQFSPDISTQRFAQYVEALRRANPNCSIIFVADYRPNGVTTDGAAVDSYALAYPTHVEALLAAAQQLNCAFVSVHDAWQGRGVTNGYITSGELHPTTAGHTNIANMITPLL